MLAGETMADKTEIMNILEQIKAKFDDPKLKSRFEGFSKNLQFTFTDMNTSFLMSVEKGVVKTLAEKTIEQPDIHVTTDSDILIGIINKKTNPMTAYSTGKLRAKGQLNDLLKLQKLL